MGHTWHAAFLESGSPIVASSLTSLNHSELFRLCSLRYTTRRNQKDSNWTTRGPLNFDDKEGNVITNTHCY